MPVEMSALLRLTAALFYFYFSRSVFTSDLPRRSRLEMSKVSPVAAVSTPPVPLFCSLRLSRIFLKRGSCITNITHIESFSDTTTWQLLCAAQRVFLHYPAEDRQTNMHTSSESSAEVRGAGEDVAQTLIPHELPTSLLNELLHLEVKRKCNLEKKMFDLLVVVLMDPFMKYCIQYFSVL